MGIEKTRHLSTYQYLQVLQVEYVVAELRRKIYVKRKDKSYYGRVLEGKERKIRDICLRNTLPSLFDDDTVREKCYSKVYNKFGYPEFHYKNEEQVQEFRAKDFYYYYHQGTEFKVNLEDSMKVGTLVSVDEQHQVAFIKLKGSTTESVFSLENISRII